MNDVLIYVLSASSFRRHGRLFIITGMTSLNSLLCVLLIQLGRGLLLDF